MTESVELYEGITTTRAIRRYQDEDIPEPVLRKMLYAASCGPSGSNRQATRYIVLRRTEEARLARGTLARGAQIVWSRKRVNDGYPEGSSEGPDSRKARMDRLMIEFAANFATVPVIVLVVLTNVEEPGLLQGASVYPGMQNLLLAARGLGYGGVVTTFHRDVDAEIRDAVGLSPTDWICATVALGKPVGNHGPVRRRPLEEIVFENRLDTIPDWVK